jgi:hypothetical protein
MKGIPEFSPYGEASSGLLRTLNAVALLYPALLVTAFYGTWFSAWLSLGHPPRASLDDPAETLGAIYWVSGIVVLLMPMGAAVAVASMAGRFVFGGCSKSTGIVFGVFNVALWIGAIVLLRSDPIGVVNWWFD